MNSIASSQPDPRARPEGGKPKKPRYRVTVKNVEKLSPSMVRVTFTGDELAAFGWSGPASHIKLMLPEPGQSEVQMPAPDGPRPTMRTYTPRRFDADARELDVEFFVHGEGPASAWAAQASVGQKLIIAGPGRSYAVDGEAPWFIIAGDETAIPAIATILEVLPPSTDAHVFIEVSDPEEERPLITLAKASIKWLKRTNSDPAATGSELEAAIRHIGFPEGHGRFYVACEAGAMRRIRKHLLQERNVDASRVVTRGYWRLGATDHPDGDYGQDA
jgi:NADPH-dependent ferric siderophore reductase